jgi:hypothetical protein
MLASLVMQFKSHTGFNYAFDSLRSTDEAQDPIYVAFRALTTLPTFKLIYAIQILFPIFRSIVCTHSS